MKEIVFHLIII